MKKRNLFAIGILTALLLTGCSGSNNAETESLKQQIAQLEQQVEALQAASESDSTESSTPAAADEVTADTSLSEQPTADESTQTQPEPAQDTASLTTTNTIEELTTFVTGYVEKVKAASPNGTASENMEQFFTLKQEEHQIDDALDLHEDELEYMYRQNALTRDEYKKLERELERLEDQLDDAEDWLERTFGIND